MKNFPSLKRSCVVAVFAFVLGLTVTGCGTNNEAQNKTQDKSLYCISPAGYMECHSAGWSDEQIGSMKANGAALSYSQMVAETTKLRQDAAQAAKSRSATSTNLTPTNGASNE